MGSRRLAARLILKATESQLAFCGDVMAVLMDAMKFRARESMLNKIAAELALTVAPFGFELSTVHAWSMHNSFCDWLSRAAVNEAGPKPLRMAVRSKDKRPACAVLSA